ncbi:MAG: gliding motility-associated C-terminal domain-containing protein [Candidatus Latescibacteria bacterium]|nr:gliding motility-associated C-terminal domain-containing protein [Candidatus Latescibacterota bacterium]
MIRFLLIWFYGVLLAVSPASGRTEYRLGGTDGNPWQASLSLEKAGTYVVLDENGQEVRRVAVGTTPHGAGTDTLIDFSRTSIRPRFIDPGVNMALTDPESEDLEIPLLYTGGEVQTTDPCIHVGQQTPLAKKMFDGNAATAFFRPFAQDPERPPGFGEGWGTLDLPKAVVVDFGAAVPVNRIRFYPRLGRKDNALLIQEFRDPRPPLEAFGEDSFAENFLAWYEIRSGDNSPAFSAGPCDLVGEAKGLPWVEYSDSRLKVLKTTRENLDVVVDLRFPPRSIRWLTLRPFPLRTWEIAEFEVYGEGFVEQTFLITQILDFGKPVNWGQIRWSGERPPGTQVEIRTRTGETPDPSLYFVRSIEGDLRPITLEEYNKIDPTGRLPTVYDAENWSFWSPPYDFAAGQEGTPLLSPGPSRYTQLAIRFFSTFKAAPWLDQLTLQFGETPSAQKVVGEIWPIEVGSFAPTTFTYVVSPTFQQGDIGFDHLEILTSTRADTIRSVKVGEDEVDLGRFPPLVLDDRIVVAFPQLKDEKKDSFKPIEVVFDAVVLRFGTKFTGWIFNSIDPDQIKQQVEAGNATFRFSGDVLAVKTPLGGQFLVDVEIFPNPFTPNGDGINEELTISYKLREVAVEQPVTLAIYDLSGALVRELPPRRTKSGVFRYIWDGRGAEGQLVPPGIYLYNLSLKAEKREARSGVLSVAY